MPVDPPHICEFHADLPAHLALPTERAQREPFIITALSAASTTRAVARQAEDDAAEALIAEPLAAIELDGDTYGV